MFSHDIWGVLGMSTHLNQGFYQVTGDLTIQNDIFYAKNLGKSTWAQLDQAPRPCGPFRGGSKALRARCAVNHLKPRVMWSFPKKMGNHFHDGWEVQGGIQMYALNLPGSLEVLGMFIPPRTQENSIFLVTCGWSKHVKPFYQHLSNLYSTWFCLFGQYICEDDDRGIQQFIWYTWRSKVYITPLYKLLFACVCALFLCRFADNIGFQQLRTESQYPSRQTNAWTDYMRE